MTPDMPIGALASRAGVNSKTIRYYEEIDLLPAPQRTSSGHRRYSEPDVERITFIKAAQRLGLTLDEIREILALRDRGQQPCQYVRQVLRREVEQIGLRIAELARLRDQLIDIDRLADTLPEPEGCTCRIIDHVRSRRSSESGQTGTSG
ncbi:MerR family transcriptional regulator [Longimycelium tulufanense]|uniref:MerR family transcriptional regulator n=1 Tax=Longimycelium tulufanense TaxID=907463 RepID=A0A8J3CGA6_9PSEU|nr:heavy metal-responsive transcriptional regulator [Longimycelium tulufanense]GGM62742.1 MerR family transcriptional regulator [Longimycelium tulufanense]